MGKKWGWRAQRPIEDLATASELAELLETLAAPVFAEAAADPNPKYVESLRMETRVSSGKRPRVAVIISAAPGIGPAVEAQRGTMGRAIGHAGG